VKAPERDTLSPRERADFSTPSNLLAMHMGLGIALDLGDESVLRKERK